MKDKIDRFALGIKIASFSPYPEMIVKSTFIYTIDLIGE